jgi:hypothetical protein
MAALFVHTAKTLSVVNTIFTNIWAVVLLLALGSAVVFAVPFMFVTVFLEYIKNLLLAYYARKHTNR